MAVNIETIDPTGLLSAFKKAIDDKKIITWSYDSAGHLTHSPEQWRYLAWFRPSFSVGKLTFNIVGRNDRVMTKEVYGVYHGRFIEAMLAHFDSNFLKAEASAMATAADNLGNAA